MVAAIVIAVATGSALRAQSVPAPAPASGERVDEECFGFAFGAWTPPLDPRAAGHGAPAREEPPPQAPSGRDWAMRLEAGRDSTLMLFPTWWPVGVAVRFPEGIDSGRDTVRGTATALVADGRLSAPRAPVLLWRVPCGKR